MCHCARTLVCFSLPPFRFPVCTNHARCTRENRSSAHAYSYIFKELFNLSALASMVLFVPYYLAMLIEEEPII